MPNFRKNTPTDVHKCHSSAVLNLGRNNRHAWTDWLLSLVGALWMNHHPSLDRPPKLASATSCHEGSHMSTVPFPKCHDYHDDEDDDCHGEKSIVASFRI